MRLCQPRTRHGGIAGSGCAGAFPRITWSCRPGEAIDMRNASLVTSGIALDRLIFAGLAIVAALAAGRADAQPRPISADDVARTRTVTSTVISPDGSRVAFVLSVPREPWVKKGRPRRIRVTHAGQGTDPICVLRDPGRSGRFPRFVGREMIPRSPPRPCREPGRPERHQKTDGSPPAA